MSQAAPAVDPLDSLTADVVKILESAGKHVTPDGRTNSDGAALVLDRSAGTLRNWRARGIGPPWYGGAKVLYRVRDLVEYNEAGRRVD